MGPKIFAARSAAYNALVPTGQSNRVEASFEGAIRIGPREAWITRMNEIRDTDMNRPRIFLTKWQIFTFIAPVAHVVALLALFLLWGMRH